MQMRKMRYFGVNSSAMAGSASSSNASSSSTLMVLVEGLRRILPVVHTEPLDLDENGPKLGLDLYDDEERYSVIYLPDVPYSTSEIVWGVILFSAIFCVNGCVLWAIAKSRELWKPRHLWVACLCVADLCVGLHKVFELLLLIFPQRELCIFKRSTLGIPYVCNMLILTLLSLDRYIAVRCPFYYSSTVTRRHVVAGFLFVVVSGGVLVAISMYFGFRDPVCRPQRVQLVSLSIVLSICSIIIFLFNSCVLRIAKKQLNLITAKATIRSRASSTRGSRKPGTYTRRISLAYQTICMRGVDLHSVPSTPSPRRPPLIIHTEEGPEFICGEDCEIDSPDPEIGIGVNKMKIFSFPVDDKIEDEEENEIEIAQQIQVQIQQQQIEKTEEPIPSTSKPAAAPDNLSHASQGDWSAKFRPFFGPETFDMAIGRQITSPFLPIPLPLPIPITLPIPLPISIPGAAVIPTPPVFPPNEYGIKIETISSRSTETRKKDKSSQKSKQKDKLSEKDKESQNGKTESENGSRKEKSRKWPIAIPIPNPLKLPIPPKITLPTKISLPGKISLPTKMPSIQIPQIPLFKKYRSPDSESQSSSKNNKSKGRGQRAQSNLQQNIDTASAQEERVGTHLSESFSPLTRAISLPSFPRAVMVVIPPDPTMPATIKILTCSDSQRDIIRFAQDNENVKFDQMRPPGQFAGQFPGQKEKQKEKPQQINRIGSQSHISQNGIAAIVNPPYTIKVALPRSRSFTCGKKFEPILPDLPAVHPYPRGLHLTRTHGIFHVWKLFPSIRFARTVLLIMVPMWIFLLPIVTIIPMQRKCMQRKQGEYELECDVVNRLWAYLQIHMRSVLPLQAVLDTLIYATGSKEFRRSFQKCIFESPARKRKNQEKTEKVNRRRLLKNRRETGVSASSTVQFRVSECIA